MWEQTYVCELWGRHWLTKYYSNFIEVDYMKERSHAASLSSHLTFVWAIMLSCLYTLRNSQRGESLVTYKGHSLPAASCGDACLASPQAHKPPATHMCVVATW